MGPVHELPSLSPGASSGNLTNGAKMKKRVSIDLSIGSLKDGSVDTDPSKLEKKSKTRRCRKRLSILMHTHVALIIVCTLAALDAACVIGQIICDILIMKETLHEWDELDKNLTSLLKDNLPILNSTEYDQENLDLKKIKEALLKYKPSHYASPMQLSKAAGFVVQSDSLNPQWMEALQSAAKAQVTGGQTAESLNVTGDSSPTPGNSSLEPMIIGIFKIPVSKSRRRRAAPEGVEGQHKLLHDLTHSFHLGSLIILSLLLLETLLKVFAMGKKVLHHKLEIFDAFVVSVSWALDVAFWEGIWAHPGEEAATILIFILPWRVVRIVNSFVLVIQEKDHVQLKIVKQRLRLSVKRSKETTRKASAYRTEVKQLQGLCRKYGASENEINACGPTGRTGRRRSSLVPVMEQAAALTLIGALGSHPSLYTMDSSSDEDDVTSRDLTRTVSNDPTLRSAYSCTTLDSADAVFTIESKRNSDGYITSDNESTADGLDNSVYENDYLSSRASISTPAARRRSPQNVGDCPGRQGHDHVVWQREALREAPSVDSGDSETPSSEGSSQGATDAANQEVPPTYHDVLTQQDTVTRL